MRGLLNVFIANSQARFTPKSVLPVPITLFRAGDFAPDYDFSVADDPGATLETSTMGWRPFVSGAVMEIAIVAASSSKYDGRGNCRNKVNGVLISIDN